MKNGVLCLLQYFGNFVKMSPKLERWCVHDAIIKNIPILYITSVKIVVIEERDRKNSSVMALFKATVFAGQ